jgi:hypothetical protein
MIPAPLDIGERTPEPVGDLEQRLGEIAGLVDLVDQVRGDEHVGAVEHRRRPGHQMIGEASPVSAKLSKSGPSSIMPPPPAPFIAEPAVDAAAASSAALSWWKVSALKSTSSGASPRASPPPISKLVASASGRRAGSGAGLALGGRPVIAAAPDLEQRILLELLGDEALDLEIRQREQLDRLLQLRRHHQRLRLAQIEARARDSSGLELEAFAQIQPADILVGDQISGRAGEQHAAVIDDVGAIDDIERLADIVIGDQHADAALLQLASPGRECRRWRSDRCRRTARRAA